MLCYIHLEHVVFKIKLNVTFLDRCKYRTEYFIFKDVYMTYKDNIFSINAYGPNVYRENL